MTRLDTFELEVRTGAHQGPEHPRYRINGFPVEFDAFAGGTGSGETLKVTGNPRSFPHGLVLAGPDDGQWDIEFAEVTYCCAGEGPFTVRLGAVTLDSESDLNLWYERPPHTFDV